MILAMDRIDDKIDNESNNGENIIHALNSYSSMCSFVRFL
jgi:hypothetical protein